MGLVKILLSGFGGILGFNDLTQKLFKNWGHACIMAGTLTEFEGFFSTPFPEAPLNFWKTQMIEKYQNSEENDLT